MDNFSLSEALIEGVVLVSRDLVASYTLERRIGEGRLRQVWRAVDTGGEPVALKIQARAAVMTDACDDDQLQNEMAAECLRCHELSATLGTVLPQFLEAFCVDRQSRYTGRRVRLHIVVMEYIHGISLDKIVSLRPLQEASAAYVLRGVCEVLQRLHSLHIVHGDVKAENLMISHEGCVHLCDFGYLKQLPACIDGCGTAHLDVFSLGITAIQLLTGRKFTQPMTQIITEQPTPRLNSNFSRDARHFVAMCMKGAPAQRIDLDDVLQSPFLRGCSDGASHIKIVAELGEKIWNFHNGL